MTRKKFSPVLFIAVFMIAICGTTAFTLSPVQAVMISHNFSKIAAAASSQSQTSTKVLSAQSPFTSDTEQSKQVNQNDDVLINNIVPSLQRTLGNTSAKQSNELTSVSNKSGSVSRDLQLIKNTPVKSSQAHPQNTDTSRLIANVKQP